MATYTATGTYNDAGLSAADKERVKSLQAQWAAYKAAGDISGMENAHAQAEAIRAAAGYSGGADGSEYNAIQQEVPYVRGATSQESYINQLYDAQRQASLDQLKSAYDENMLTLDQSAAQIPGQYQQARNRSAASSEVAKANFNEYAAASGLNTGAGGQVQLSMANAEQGNQSALYNAERQALQEVENQRVALRTNYQNAVAEAVSAGNLERAQALYEEAVRVDNSMVETELQQIQLNQAYEEAQAKKQQEVAENSNPLLKLDLPSPSAEALAASYEYWIQSGRSATDIETNILNRVNSGEISSAVGAETLARLGLV